MDLMTAFGDTAYAFALFFSAVGSAYGTGIAGLASIGAWKKCYLENKKTPFIIVAYVGAPLSQTIYGMILMNAIVASSGNASSAARFSAGLLGGIAIGLSAWLQGKAAAAASDAYAEAEKGFANYIIVLGVIETVALFVMVFFMTALK